MDKHRLYAYLTIGYLVFFVLIFSRRPILKAMGKEDTTVVVQKTIHHIRAENQWNIIHADSCLHLVKDGDIVLRSGTDRMSELFKKFNTIDPSYSHAGIVMIENGYPMVYNMNATKEHPHLPIRRDSIQNFVGPFDNTAYAVYRVGLTVQEKKELKNLLVEYYNNALPFDANFDLKNDSAFYGTELVYKSFITIKEDEDFFPTTLAGGYEFVSTDNLFKKPGLKMVCKIIYKQ